MEMVLVCLLLILGVLGWWVMDALDRFFQSPSWRPDQWEPEDPPDESDK